MRETRDLFIAAVVVLLTERLRLDGGVTAAACRDAAADQLDGLSGSGGERERALVARFTEDLAGRISGADEAMAAAVYDLVHLAVLGVLWPEASGVEAADDLAGWVR